MSSTLWLRLCEVAFVTVQAMFFCVPQQSSDLVVDFPADNSIGVVTVSKPPHYVGKHLTFDQAAHVAHRAQGQVTVPKDGFIGLEVSGKSAEDLSFLTTLQPKALQSIKLRGAKLGKVEMGQLVKLKSLVKLELSNCEFSPDAFDDLPAMPELLSLSISQRSNENAASLPIAKWVAKLPKLESLYSRPSLMPQL